jgi:hypothetical protein
MVTVALPKYRKQKIGLGHAVTSSVYVIVTGPPLVGTHAAGMKSSKDDIEFE